MSKRRLQQICNILFIILCAIWSVLALNLVFHFPGFTKMGCWIAWYVSIFIFTVFYYFGTALENIEYLEYKEKLLNEAKERFLSKYS